MDTPFGSLGPRWELHYIDADGHRHVIHTTDTHIDVNALVATIMPTKYSRRK
jgi:hypothetical protein